MMKPSEIEKTFPNGLQLPEPITDICRFLAAHGYPISGCFKLSKIGMEDVVAWFPNDQVAQAGFMPVGRGACGEVYSLWLTGDRSPGDAPVVILGSEGESLVLAANAVDFCRLLCLGYSELGRDDPASEPSEYEATKPWREFFLKKYGFDLPGTAQPIIEDAQARFPDFQKWVETHQN